MNVTHAFAEYLEGAGLATLGTDMFISRAPSSTKAGNRVFWLKAAGGSTPIRSVNGTPRVEHVIEIYHRDVAGEGVYETLQSLGDLLSDAGCVPLSGYNVMSISTNGPWADQDLDDEEREVGMIQATIIVHKEN